MKEFVHLHTHTDLSNNSMFESVTNVGDYINKAIEWNMPAVCITNHGSVASWLSNKNQIEKSGLKYIHASEIYVTLDNNDSESKTNDNYHMVLIAKNWDGVKELNTLSSNSYNREDNHYYYKPRVFFDELKETSDNILILTACLGSGLNQSRVKNKEEELKMWIDFFVDNKHRVYLEVQPHINQEQMDYNKFLLELSEKYGFKIVATNDVHNLTEEHNAIAKAVKESKGIVFDADDEFDTTFKSRDEMFSSFVSQGVLTECQIENALDNTVDVINQVESFEVDTSIRYPHIFRKDEQMVGRIDLGKMRKKPFLNSLDVFRHLIAIGYKERGLHKLPEDEQKIYKSQVIHEVDTYIKTDSIDYMLLEYSLKKEARDKMINPKKSIRPGYGRGSAAGSLVSYLLRITDVDSVRENLSFERFMSVDKVGVPDIDSDWLKADKEAVTEYLIKNRDDINCAQIYTKGVSKVKSAVKAIGKSMGYSAQEMNELSKELDNSEETITRSMRERYEELFNKVDAMIGSVSNFSRHAGGVLVSSEDIKAIIGLQTLGNDNMWVTQLDMLEIESLNLVKLDILGVDNIGLLNETMIMANLPFLTPDSGDIIDFEDEKVWKSIHEDTTGIFQFESDRAGKILKEILSPKNVEKVKRVNPNVRMIDLMSLASAAQRPSGQSYVEKVMNGEINENGHPALNKLLSDTNQFLVYQEQQSKFLVEFAGFSTIEADSVRKGISKKRPEIMDREVPKIKPAFIKTMIEKYDDTEEHASEIADAFIQIFMDSVDYGFNKSHSISYSYIGYISGWLRYYYPLEFTAVALEIWKKTDKEKGFLEYAEKNGIKILPPKFRKSKGGYATDIESNSIFEGTSHIKGGNADVGDLLYTLRDREYRTFTDLVIDVLENAMVNENMSIQDFYYNTKVEDVKELDKELKTNPSAMVYESNPLGINKTKMLGLIRLGFFEEFGKGKKLEQVYEKVAKEYKPKNKTFSGKQSKYLSLLEFEKSLPNEDYSILEICEYELEYTGRVTVKSEEIPAKYGFVTKIDKIGKTRTSASLYVINKGKETPIKVGSRLYTNVPFQEGDLISVETANLKPKGSYVDGVWTKSLTEKELWLEDIKMIRRTKINKK